MVLPVMPFDLSLCHENNGQNSFNRYQETKTKIFQCNDSLNTVNHHNSFLIFVFGITNGGIFRAMEVLYYILHLNCFNNSFFQTLVIKLAIQLQMNQF